jgi:hypothetical protein
MLAQQPGEQQVTNQDPPIARILQRSTKQVGFESSHIKHRSSKNEYMEYQVGPFLTGRFPKMKMYGFQFVFLFHDPLTA